MRQTERAVIELRQGDPVYFADIGGGGVLALALEAAHGQALSALAAAGASGLELVLSDQRAGVLGLQTDHPGISVALDGGEHPDELLALAAAPAPVTVWRRYRDRARPASLAQRASLALAKCGRLLPAMITTRVDGKLPDAFARQLDQQHLLAVPVGDALELEAGGPVRLHRISEARIPLADSEQTRFVLFRERGGVLEHVAIVIGNPAQWPDPVPVRLHSACLTGDLFGSLRCDCGEQLRSGVGKLVGRGGGVLLYLAQEGRGIGLANKLRAYALQDGGLDTVDADRTLGFGDDERRYGAAVAMLQALGIERISLLTNNPAKIAALHSGGIEVVAREALHGQLTEHNRRYLSAKARRAGHWLEEVLAADDSEDAEAGA
jgi:GTP cyclohydrolase II